MTIKEVFDEATKNDLTDLQALIMFLVYEKKVLSFDDTKDKLVLYYREKFNSKMNQHLLEYKNKLNIKYKPNVYEIKVEQKDFHTIYVLADNFDKAMMYAKELFYKPISTSICSKERLMTTWDKKGKEIVVTMQSIVDQEKKIPAFLGGF